MRAADRAGSTQRGKRLAQGGESGESEYLVTICQTSKVGKAPPPDCCSETPPHRTWDCRMVSHRGRGDRKDPPGSRIHGARPHPLQQTGRRCRPALHLLLLRATVGARRRCRLAPAPPAAAAAKGAAAALMLRCGSSRRGGQPPSDAVAEAGGGTYMQQQCMMRGRSGPDSTGIDSNSPQILVPPHAAAVNDERKIGVRQHG